MITFSLDLNNGLTSLNCETAGKDYFLQALTEFSTKLYDTNHILSAAYCVEKKGNTYTLTFKRYLQVCYTCTLNFCWKSVDEFKFKKRRCIPKPCWIIFGKQNNIPFSDYKLVNCSMPMRKFSYMKGFDIMYYSRVLRKIVRYLCSVW